MKEEFLTREQEAAIRAALPTELPAPDNSGLLEMAAILRAQHQDPTSPIYAGHPERVAQSELQIKATLLRAGVQEVPVTPLTVAKEQHAAQWRHPEAMQPGLQSFVDEQLAMIPEAQIASRAAELRSQDPAEYDALLADAGYAIPAAAKASLPVLKILANQSRYAKAKEAARPR
jgi:hypothetical protein